MYTSNTPYWPDDCEHGQEAYVCSFEVTEPTGTVEKCDLYIHGSFPEVCIRVGRDGDYLSVGCLSYLLSGADIGSPIYKAAVRAMIDHGNFSWTKRV